MVKYKNFGSSGQSVGSFSFASQMSQVSTKTTESAKSIKSKSYRRNERSPSITRHGSEEDDCRDEDGSRFDPRIVLRDSTEEEDIKEEEVESLYDMISYNGITDEHSMSACASYSYSAGDTGETDSSAGFSDPHEPTPNSRRSKLSYMGYVPMSPNTAAAMAMKDMRDKSETRRHRNGSQADNNSGHTAGEATSTTGSTFPSIKVDDTSTSRRRTRNYDDDSLREEEEELRQSASAGTDDYSSQGIADKVTEYLTVGQQKCLEQEKLQQSQNKDSTTVTSSSAPDQNSRVEDGTIATSVASSVMPNSCTGHPAMKTMNQGRLYQKANNLKTSKQDFHPLSPVMASPTPQQQPRASTNGNDAWADMSVLSPLTAGVSANGMAPPSLNHPPTMMQQQWNPNRGLQHQHGYNQPQPMMYPYGVNHQQMPHPVQQPQQPFQPGFVPRNPVLARQLQAFHQYHNKQNPQEQLSPISPPSMNHSPQEPQVSKPVETPPAKNDFEPKTQKNDGGVSSQGSKGESSSSDHQPFLICGPEGPRLMDNVKFVTPTPNRSSGSNATSLSSHSRAYGASYGGGSIGMGCAHNPAGMKCQSYIANFINTCGAIVNHGYHIDNKKSSSKEKRAKFGMVAEKSIAGLAPSEDDREETGGNGFAGIGNIGSGLNEVAENAKKIFDAGNNMMSTLPKDFQNLTSSAAYHNVFDTFQKYASVKSPVQSEDNTEVLSLSSNGPDETEATKGARRTAPLSPISAQREHFKKLRRMRRAQNSPGPASSNEETLASSISTRYTRNLHTKIHQEKLDKANGAEGRIPEDPEESKRESRQEYGQHQIGNTGKDPSGCKDDDSHCTWATALSQEESERGDRSLKPDPLPKSEFATVTLDDILGDKSENVVTSTSSGMSESLVGSDVDDDERQMDPMMNSSLSDDERHEGEEHVLLNSFDHNEFPYTPLDVIEEGSEDEETIANQDTSVDERSINATPSDVLSTDGTVVEKSGFRTSMKSMIGIVRILFVGMLFFQCGTIICLWDQIADQIRTVEGGPEILATAEGFVSNLKVSGVSLVTTAREIIPVDQIDVSMGEIFSEIESRTTEMMGTANKFLAGLRYEQEGQRTEKDELMLFHQLVDDAFGDDDVFHDVSQTETEIAEE